MIGFTEDGWETVSTALGNISYYNTTTGTQHNTYGLVAKEVISGYIAGTEIESSNMTTGLIQNLQHKQDLNAGNYIDMNISDTSISDFIHTPNFQVNGQGTLTSTSGRIQNSTGDSYVDLSGVNDYLNFGDNFSVSNTGVLTSKSGRLERNSTYYVDLSGNSDYLHFGDNFKVDNNGNLTSKSGRFEIDSTHYIDMSGSNDYVHFGDDMIVKRNGNVTVSGTIKSVGDTNKVELSEGVLKGFNNRGQVARIDWDGTVDNDFKLGLSANGYLAFACDNICVGEYGSNLVSRAATGRFEYVDSYGEIQALHFIKGILVLEEDYR